MTSTMTLTEIKQEIKEAGQQHHAALIERDWDVVAETECRIQELEELMFEEFGEDRADHELMFLDSDEFCEVINYNDTPDFW